MTERYDKSMLPAVALSLRPDVVATVVKDGAVLLDLSSKYFYSVNMSGWSILQMFESGATVEEVLNSCREVGVTEGNMPAIVAFITELSAEKLVTEGTTSSKADLPGPKGTWSPPTIEKHKEPLQRIMTSAFDPSIPMAE
jgi:hypothetical protein